MIGPDSFGGVKIIIDDDAMSDRVIDWSRVRSPSRAIRRVLSGRRKPLPYTLIPKTYVIETPFGMVMHSQMARELRERISHE